MHFLCLSEVKINHCFTEIHIMTPHNLPEIKLFHKITRLWSDLSISGKIRCHLEGNWSGTSSVGLRTLDCSDSFLLEW